MGFTRKKMTEHTPKAERPSDVDWGKVAPTMVHVDHSADSDVAISPPAHLAVVVPDRIESVLGTGLDGAAQAPGTSPEASMVHVDHSRGLRENTVVYLPVDQIVPNPRQPRTTFDEDDLADLAASIASSGVLQPVVVRAAGEGIWELIMGERRLRASVIAGRETIPAIVRDVPDDQLLKEAIIENIQRAALNPLEEALALQALLDDWGVSQEEVGVAVGKSRISVSHTLGILRLPEDVQRKVASGVLTKGHAKVLMGIDNEAAVRVLADRVVAETLSVRGLEEAVVLMDLSEQKTPRRGRSTTRRRASYPELTEALESRLDTRVRIEGSRRRGRIVIDFGDPDDLKRIFDILQGRAQS